MTANLRPSLTALRALEAAERRRSFTQAADELHVTHSAVSHQVRQLESQLGVSLFTRAGTEMLPTGACIRLAVALRRSLFDIDQSLESARTGYGSLPQALKLSVMADLAHAWLIPRLDDFSRANPEIDLSLIAHSELAAPDPHSVDVGIWHRRIEQSGFRSIKLLDDYVIAVCTPGFKMRQAMPDRDMLAGSPLLRFALRSWREFFEAAGIEYNEPERGPIFGDAGSLLSAALAGQGIAMLRHQLVSSYLLNGTLVPVGGTRIHANLEYYISWREGHPREAIILNFYDWVRSQLHVPKQMG